MRFLALLVSTHIALLAPAFAFTDGSLGTASTGEITVSAEIAEPAQAKISITGLKDINFDKTAGDSALAVSVVAACVYMDMQGTYSLDVEAGPLTSGEVHYPYSMDIYQNVVSSVKLDLEITDETKTGTAEGFLPSTSSGCVLGTKLMIAFADDGADDADSAFSASAKVTLTVTPD